MPFFPDKFMDSWVTRWNILFNNLLKKSKDDQPISIENNMSCFINCNKVKFTGILITYDKVKKEFELYARPDYKQDNLCFDENNRQQKIIIKIRSAKIRSLFKSFFTEINKIYYCLNCGECSPSSKYHKDVELCEKCLVEALIWGQKDPEICVICQEEGYKLYETKCGHYFHRRCLSQIKPNPYLKCPLCREPLNPIENS